MIAAGMRVRAGSMSWRICIILGGFPFVERVVLVGRGGLGSGRLGIGLGGWSPKNRRLDARLRYFNPGFLALF